ncbi:SPRY domain-containing proteins [Plasmopara halstedii]|uniref:SPRY domain-containing proteins n=1 Tax=Plasmopara halstedii TaxID=4781 RepID=A0A0P1AAH6_PLAHL|nr:SPRY domain-containing proteins [Plasmopara halstedii]CEG37357.1 SPRY domain-containing proteins [Plasmopara halstedii]|eukprot:XP_024573726.1 SPRY domain-containing proteins [Plasmopara halstedii]
MVTSLSNLGYETLAYILTFALPSDVESITVASPVVARDVIPFYPSIWEHIFRQRWEALNFQLDGDVPVQINKYLDALFPTSCTLSRKLQLLTHAIKPVPSFADIRQTQKASGYKKADHRIISLDAPYTSQLKPVDFALDGVVLGDDRCVRANLPFLTTFYVAVIKRNLHEDGHEAGQSRPVYEVGVVSGGYFELSLSKRQHRNITNLSELEHEAMTSIGLVSSRFPLVGKQPGWTRTSYGYHGDDGCFYHGTSFELGRPLGPTFRANCTVGCGIRVDMRTGAAQAFFANNGRLIHGGTHGAYMECEHQEWYPAVGLDSYDALHLNFGQEPFKYITIADELFRQCIDMGNVVSKHLQWRELSDTCVAAKDVDNDLDSNVEIPRKRKFLLI